MQIPFIGAAYQHRSRTVDAQECVNLYPETNGPGSKSVSCLVGTPGSKLFVDIAEGGFVRGLYTTGSGRLYAVVGGSVGEISKLGKWSRIGYLSSQLGPVTMADNGLQLLIADGRKGYVIDLGDNALTVIDAEGFPGGSHVAIISQRFIINRRNTGQFQFSALADALTWDAADFYTAEGSGDNLTALVAANNELWLFGPSSAEVWYNTGDTDEPFSRVAGAFVDVGTVAPYSVSTNGGNVFWLGSNAQGNNIVWMASGYQPQRVSTHAIEALIGGLARTDDASGYTYQQEGHAFYVMHFPTANRTLCYDLTTGMWHVRSHYDSVTNQENMHRSICYAYFDGKSIVGDYKSGKLFALDLDQYTDDGDEIRRVRTTPHLYRDGKRMFFDSFQVEMEVGGGPIGTESRAMLQWSDDGGNTWSGEKWVSAGKLGEYRTRVKWNRLGSSRDRVFRFMLTDPVRCVLVNATSEIGVEA